MLSPILRVGIKGKESIPSNFPCFTRQFGRFHNATRPKRILFHGVKRSCPYPGIYIAIFELIANTLGLRYEWVAIPTSKAFYPALRSGLSLLLLSPQLILNTFRSHSHVSLLEKLDEFREEIPRS